MRVLFPLYIVCSFLLSPVCPASAEEVRVNENEGSTQFELPCTPVTVPRLHSAVKQQSLDEVKALLDKGDDPNTSDECGQTALHVAVGINGGNRKLVELLIAYGADINTRTNTGDTPLDVLFYSGCLGGVMGFDWSIVTLLYNPKVPARCSLQAAVLSGDRELVQAMLKHGVDINSMGCTWATPLYLAIEERLWKIAEYLINNGANPNLRNGANRPGATPLHAAVEIGDLRTVNLLLKHGADVGAHSMFGHTPLHWSARIGNIRMAKLLLKHGANLEERTGTVEFGRRTHENASPNFCSDKIAGNKTPFHVAAEEGIPQMVTFLLSQGADIHAQDAIGQNALFFAVSSGSLSTVKELIRAGLAVNSSDKKQRTPLHYAALVGDNKIVAYLLDNGADIMARDQAKRTALHWAAAHGQPEVCKLVLERGADVDAHDEAGMTPLEHAREWAWDTPWHRNREKRQRKVIKILSYQ